MKVTAHILATALLAAAVSAQTAPASQTVKQNPPQGQPKAQAQPKPQTQTKNQTPAKSQAQTTKTLGSAKTIAKNPFKPKPKTTESAAKQPAKPDQKTQTSSQKAPAKQAAPAQAKAVPKPEPAKPAEPKPAATTETALSAPKRPLSPGKRDPFVSPLAAAAARGPGAGCTTGKRCLLVDQLVLKGIVQMKTGNFALVENISKRPYVLHENDALFNGSVVRITGDSIVFRETSNDILGRPVSKEVVKKVSAPAV